MSYVVANICQTHGVARPIPAGKNWLEAQAEDEAEGCIDRQSGARGRCVWVLGSMLDAGVDEDTVPS